MAKKTKSRISEPVMRSVKGFQPIPGNEHLPINPNIPTHHADIVNVLITQEGSALISFFARTPGLNNEECRVSFNHELARKIVDLFCVQLDYYPGKPSLPSDEE